MSTVDSEAIGRIGVVMAVRDVARLTAFYRDAFGFEVEAEFDAPPYAILTRNSIRLSLAEEGHAAGDLPDRVMTAPRDPASPSTMLVVETADCEALLEHLRGSGARPVSEVFRPPWGGARCFVADPEDNLIELEQLA